jgi:hypothetical protein
MSDYDDDMPLPDADQPHTEVRLSPEAGERLLNLSITTARAGNKAEARSLLRALTRHQPDMLRAWLWLAGVAETATEQQQALEHVLTLDPEHPLARQGLERLRSREAAVEPTPTAPAPAPAPAAEAARPAPAAPTPAPEAGAYETEETTLQRNRWIYLAIAALVILALILSLGRLGLRRVSEDEPVPTSTLPVQVLASPIGEPTALAAGATAAAATPAPTTTTAATALPATTPTTPTTVATNPTSPPATSAPAALTPQATGSVLQRAGWQATLLRSDYARFIDGAVGDVQPEGRFVLTLLAVSNTTDTPRQIPADLFVLVDEQGRSYTPDPAASIAYLNVNPAGQWGDLAINDAVPPGGGLYAMPLLFDVPRDATDLLLTMGQQVDEGWPIRDGTQPGEAPAPQSDAG